MHTVNVLSNLSPITIVLFHSPPFSPFLTITEEKYVSSYTFCKALNTQWLLTMTRLAFAYNILHQGTFRWGSREGRVSVSNNKNTTNNTVRIIGRPSSKTDQPFRDLNLPPRRAAVHVIHWGYGAHQNNRPSVSAITHTELVDTTLRS